jgi:choline kinase
LNSKLIVVDFEYAGPNPASFDIANHFHEWTVNYHSDTPHLLYVSRYPTLAERRNFYLSYLRHTGFSAKECKYITDVELESAVAKLDRQVQIWSPASHAHWFVWGLVQAYDDLENNIKVPEFNYIGYAKCRLEGFRQELRGLGVV